MTTAKRPHIPRVVITTPTPTPERVYVPSVLTKVEVDGAQWYITAYRIEGDTKDNHQSVTLTFLADLTVEHQ